MTTPRLLIFDLDGTLVDTAPDLCASLNHVLRELGRPETDVDTVRHLVGHGARMLIERGLALSGGGTEDEVLRGIPLFMDFYGAHIADGSAAFDGVEHAMDQLAAMGWTLAVCTNKPQKLADALVAALGWQGRFAAVVGADSVSARKPAAAHVLETIALAGGSVETTVFLGDSNVDVAAARAAQVPVMVVSFGFSDVPAVDLGADAVIDHYAELIPAMAALGRG